MGVLTLTGIDKSVPVSWIDEMQQKFVTPGGVCGLEFAFLQSPKAGQSPRYILPEDIAKFTHFIAPTNLAFHLCGEYARMVHERRWDELCSIIDFRTVNRVQVNSIQDDEKAILTLMQFSAHIERSVVMQWRRPEFPFVGGLHLLQDRSGGTGQLPEEWASPDPLCAKPYNYHRKGNTKIGYAGGLNPDNIVEQLAKIDRASKNKNFWVDCESGIRTDDLFDTDKAEAMARAVFTNFKWGMKA